MGRSITIALLVQIGGKGLAIMMLSCEMGVYLLFKVVRRDFRYWMPLPRGTSLLVSLLMRVTVKVLADFTGKRASERARELREDAISVKFLTTNTTQACCTCATRTNWAERTGSLRWRTRK